MTQNGQQKKSLPLPVALTWVARISRLLIIAPLLYAGVTKLADPQSFAVIIAGFGLLPESLLMPAALLLPVLEICIAIGLLFNICYCLPAAATLLILFITVLSYGIWLGLDIDCGCFGPEDPEQAYHGLWSALFRDLAFLVPILYLIWFQHLTNRNKTVLSF